MDRDTEPPRHAPNEDAPPPSTVRRQKPLRFADVFAGLGGFHVALSRLGHQAEIAGRLRGRRGARNQKAS